MITLPTLFEVKLQKSPELSAAVQKNFALFEPWLEQSGMPFFPGFTDHSPRHINDVLETAASLISDISRDILSAEDVTVLCMSILLHDCGMHLTQDGFRALIATIEPPMISGLEDRPWHQLWNDFLAEASRFGQDRLVAIFGDAEPFRVEQLDLDNLSERDCLLIGEFVRRHHARLAHEIALRGVPCRSGVPLELVGLDEEIRDLAGLVARSHGLSIRDTFSYIEARYGLIPEHRRVKTPFLMAVLRIADYVQVQSERALKSLLSVKELRSPVSRQEWRNHFAVRDVSTRHEDPEALYVRATPTDVRTYLKLVALFKDIQRELDHSWAVIGEVYGRRGELASLGLSLRRIRSNLDKPSTFARTVPYIPIKAGFDASGPGLLNLLVGPLYDYSYEVGIRELVQNAVDACRELVDLTRREATDMEESSREYDVIVECKESDDGTGWITVHDKGVGMTLETVTNYFLIAGASFRNSDVWKRQHVDENGRSRVLRGGRFGVGALAAFLLGDEIHVRTRHVDREEADGLQFTARIDDSIVELRRCSAPVGTTIAVRVADPKVLDRLRPFIPREMAATTQGVQDSIVLKQWADVDWFAQSRPRVKYVWDGFNVSEPEYDRPKIRIRAEFRPPSDNLVPLRDGPMGDWHSLPEPNPYEAIFWRFHVDRHEHAREGIVYEQLSSAEITVNGIHVQKIGRYAHSAAFINIPIKSIEFGPQFILARPSIAIFDPSGLCPINLQRSAVAFDKMGIDERLATDILSHHVKEIVDEARACLTVSDFRQLCRRLAKQETVVYQGQVSPVCATSTGITLSAPHALAELKVDVLYFVNTSKNADPTFLKDILEDGEALIFREGNKGIANDLSWFRGFFTSDAIHTWYSSLAGFPYVRRRAAVSIMPNRMWQLANEKGKVNRQILQTLQHRNHNGGSVLVTAGDANAAMELVHRLDKLSALFGTESEVAAWAVVQGTEPPEQRSLLYSIWGQTVGGAECRPNQGASVAPDSAQSSVLLN
ncbi:ATP-binding protein [Cupriavidus gilardii]|uniref:HD domain-containing protein n=1 Tax=Cupriavidus gilardii TaxID=82541 RepID=UPI001ABE8AF8|nr:ATP-binding protein [Cupriavidus gilardii]MBO4123693.1 ATP-binding protein [Cupriavidus gilardii]